MKVVLYDCEKSGFREKLEFIGDNRELQTSYLIHQYISIYNLKISFVTGLAMAASVCVSFLGISNELSVILLFCIVCNLNDYNISNYLCITSFVRGLKTVLNVDVSYIGLLCRSKCTILSYD